MAQDLATVAQQDRGPPSDAGVMKGRWFPCKKFRAWNAHGGSHAARSRGQLQPTWSKRKRRALLPEVPAHARRDLDAASEAEESHPRSFVQLLVREAEGVADLDDAE